jgi:hypothetical protein
MDFTEVEALLLCGESATMSMEALDLIAARYDSGTPERRMAIVAPQPWLYGIARMYAVYRQREHPRAVRVCRNLDEARALLAGPPWEEQ